MSIASDIIREHTDTIILSALLLRDSYGYEINKKIKLRDGYPSPYIRLWRSWITQQIPILKNGGSNPFGRARPVRL